MMALRAHAADPHAAEIAAFYDAGRANAALARSRRARGYRGPDATARRALAALRAPRPAVPVPAPRHVAWLRRKPDAELAADERTYVVALGAACPALAKARSLALRFTAMLRERDPNALRRGDRHGRALRRLVENVASNGVASG